MENRVYLQPSLRFLLFCGVSQFSIVLRSSFLILAICLSLAAEPGLADDSWLTEPERAFFASFGGDTEIGGKLFHAELKIDGLPEIANRAPESLKKRILAISDAHQQVGMTAEEKQGMKEAATALQSQMKAQMFGLLIGAIRDEDPLDMSVDFVNGITRQGAAQKAWAIQRDALVRQLMARTNADLNLNAILGDLERRSGKKLTDADVAWRLEAQGKHMRVVGKASKAIGSPIIQIEMRRRLPNGNWTATNLVSGKVLEAMGVTGMDAKSQATGVSLAAAQELAASLPSVATELLPDIAADSSVTVLFPIRSSLSFESINIKLWSKEGVHHIENVPGLETVQKKARKWVEDEQLKRMTPQQKQAYSRMRLARELQAKDLMKFGQKMVTLKRPDEARQAFQRAINLDPDSATAKSAQTALKKLDK
jgi:hypothetical protein